MTTFLILVLILVAAWWLGWKRPFVRLSDMAVAEVELQSDLHLVSIAKRRSQIKISAKEVEKAAEITAMLDSLR